MFDSLFPLLAVTILALLLIPATRRHTTGVVIIFFGLALAVIPHTEEGPRLLLAVLEIAAGTLLLITSRSAFWVAALQILLFILSPFIGHILTGSSDTFSPEFYLYGALFLVPGISALVISIQQHTKN